MYSTKEITGENQFTDAGACTAIAGFYDYSAQGTSTSKVTLQRSLDNGLTWEDIDSNIAPFSLTGFQAYPPYRDGYFPKPSVLIRLGVKTGDFVAGTLILKVGV